MKPLTAKQRQLAEENHDLVYQFLNENCLPESQYYDVVIFGYLCAAQEYCEIPELQKYSFATIAWRRMKHSVYHHKDEPNMVGLSDACDKEKASLFMDGLTEEVKMKLLLHSLAKSVPQKQMRIIRMKMNGCRMHEIAKEEHMTFQDINRALEDVRDIVIEVVTH